MTRRISSWLFLSPAEYKNILSLLKELDAPPRQVLIEATVAELTLTDDLKYGLEWYINNRMFGGAFNLQISVWSASGAWPCIPIYK